MKIGLFNTDSGGGGAAIACRRLYKGLLGQGADAKFVHLNRHSFYGKWSRNFLLAMEKQKIARVIGSRKDLFYFSSGSTGTPSVARQLGDFDVVNLHYITQGFLSLGQLERLVKSQTPVVWTLHDMWAFTGGCHHSFDCTHYRQHCGNCFYLRNPAPNDYSATVHARKYRIFDKLNLTVVTPSHWLGKKAAESSLFGNKPVRVIPNPLSGSAYAPQDKALLRKELGLSPHKRILLFGAANATDHRKGIQYLNEALEIIRQRIGEEAQNLQLVVVGNMKQEGQENTAYESRYTGFVSDEALMAKYYAAADVFILPSLAENLPNSLIESLACATPVVGFDVGGIPDIIQHRQNGYLARYKNAADLAEGILYVLDPQNHPTLARQSRAIFMEKFEEKACVNQYMHLYESLL